MAKLVVLVVGQGAFGHGCDCSPEFVAASGASGGRRGCRCESPQGKIATRLGSQGQGKVVCMNGKARGGLYLPGKLVGVDVAVSARGVKWNRRPGAVQDGLVRSGGAQRYTESDSKNDRQRGTRGSPESLAGEGSVSGDSWRIAGSLVAE